MLHGGITQGFSHGGDAPAAVGKQDGSGGHTRLRFFLQKGLAVMLLQEPFRLPCAKPQLSGQLL